VGGGSGVWPLSASADGRRVLTAAGSSWSGNGITPWSLFVQTTQEEADAYLADRAARGVNALLANLIEHFYSAQTPHWRNANGDLPFSGTLADGTTPDFTTPNEAYWAHVDHIVAAAEALGITLFVTPAYIGWQHNQEGWATEVDANGVSRMTAYGTWLGARYTNAPNLVWVAGGDGPPKANELAPELTLDLTDHYNALMTALLAEDPDKLTTAHSQRTRSSVDDYDQPWLRLNASYSNNQSDITAELEESWAQAAMPTFQIESNYGEYDGSADQAQRETAYRSILGPGISHFMGINGDWEMAPGWEDHLDEGGAQYLPFVARLQAARDLPSLAPDLARQVVSDYDQRAVRASSQVVVAYTAGQSLTVHGDQLEPGTYRVRWYSPIDGTTSDAGTVEIGSGSEVFDSPGERVLLLDLASLGLGAP
jgi:hypothetical protein